MKSLAFKISCGIVAIIVWGVMGVEILANGARNLTLIEVCAYIMLACLIGLLVCALIDLIRGRKS